MFEVRVISASVLKHVLESLKDLVDDITLQCDQTGIKLETLDKWGTAFISMLLEKRGFDYYQCQQSIVLSIKIENLYNIISFAGDVAIRMVHANGDDNLQIEFEKESAKFNYTLRLMDIVLSDGYPDRLYENADSITLKSSQLATIFSHLNKVSGDIVIKFNNQCVKFSAKGDIGILASVTLDQNSSNEEAVIIEIHEPVSLTFSSRYLVLFFAKAKNLSNRAKVVMKKDRPLKVEYIIPDYGYVFFYLAPKIEDSDEN